MWLKSQEQIFRNLTEAVGKFQSQVLENKEATGNQSDFQKLFDTWLTKVTDSLNGNSSSGASFVSDAFSKSARSSDLFFKLYDIWLPFLHASRERTFSGDLWNQLADPAKYKELLDMIFGFNPSSLADFYAQSTKIFESGASSAQHFMGPWIEASGKTFSSLPPSGLANLDTFLKIYQNLFQAFDTTFGKVFRTPALGKDREKIELFSRSCDDFSHYLAKSIQYKEMMYRTGLKAMEKTAELVAKKSKSGEEVKTFEDFFNIWIGENEKTFHSLFETEEYAKKQGELLEFDLRVRRSFSSIVELYLRDFPIALRSEMDDLYKTIYELKKRVSHLEKGAEVSA